MSFGFDVVKWSVQHAKAMKRPASPCYLREVRLYDTSDVLWGQPGHGEPQGRALRRRSPTCRPFSRPCCCPTPCAWAGS